MLSEPQGAILGFEQSICAGNLVSMGSVCCSAAFVLELRGSLSKPGSA